MDKVEYVENYFKQVKKTAIIRNVKFDYYKSLRGYYKHSHLLSDIKLKEFNLSDYRLWNGIMVKVPYGSVPVVSGGLDLRYKDFKDYLSKNSFYKSRQKFVDLELLIETPFKNYYILNPLYVLKLKP